MHDQGGRIAATGKRRVGPSLAMRVGPGARMLIPLVTTALMLPGCAGDDGSATAPEPAPTQTGTVTPDPTPEPTPEVTTEPTADPTEALEAEITEFFEEYIDLVNESWTSEEALELRREMFSDSCEACLAGYQFAERAQLEQLDFEGGPAIVENVEFSYIEDDLVVFTTKADYPEGDLRNSDGESLVQFDAAMGRQTVYQAIRTEGGSLMIIASEAL